MELISEEEGEKGEQNIQGGMGGFGGRGCKRQRRLNRSTNSDSLPAESTSKAGIDAVAGCRRRKMEA